MLKKEKVGEKAGEKDVALRHLKVRAWENRGEKARILGSDMPGQDFTQGESLWCQMKSGMTFWQRHSRTDFEIVN